MTGAEHYREAERLLTQAVEWTAQLAAQAVDAITTGQPWQGPDAAEINAAIASSIAMAQVHATLAHAAATALTHLRNIGDCDAHREAANEWHLAVTEASDA